MTTIFLTLPIVPHMFDKIMLRNESRPLNPMFFANYKFIDGEDYFSLIYTHEFLGTAIGMTVGLNSELVVLAFIQHANCILASIGYKQHLLIF